MQDYAFYQSSPQFHAPAISYDEDFGGLKKMRMAKKDRFCAKCGKKMSRYQRDGEKLCWGCQKPVLKDVNNTPSQQPAKYTGPMVEKDMVFGKIKSYQPRLEVAQRWGFESVAEFVVDFYKTVGSAQLLSKELLYSRVYNKSSGGYMLLEKLGIPIKKLSPVTCERRYKKYRMDRLGY